MAGVTGVQVAILHARPFGEVVDDRFGDGDVVVYEGGAFVVAAASQNRDACQTKTGGSDDLAIAISLYFYFLLLESYKFGINGNVRASGRCFDIRS